MHRRTVASGEPEHDILNEADVANEEPDKISIDPKLPTVFVMEQVWANAGML